MRSYPENLTAKRKLDEAMVRCTKCILPSTYPGITFDSSGVCSFCGKRELAFGQTPGDKSKSSEQLLTTILEKRKGSFDYDCLVPLSGGKDSTYVLLLAVRKYRLRTLAITVDNGFMSDIGRNNVTKAVDKLGVDHVFFKPSWSLMKRAYRAMLNSYGFSCVFCDYILGRISKYVQKKFQVPIILYGSSRAQGKPALELYRSDFSAISQALVYDYSADYPWLERFNEPEPSSLRMIRKKLANVSAGLISILKEKTLNYDEICLPFFLEWPEETIGDILRSEVDWEQMPDRSEHFDCLLADIKDYVARTIWGFSWQEIKWSDLIRDGQLTREEALRILRKTEERLKHEPAFLDDYLKKLEFDKSEFFKILNDMDTCPFRKIV
jgi:hypothetical protein